MKPLHALLEKLRGFISKFALPEDVHAGKTVYLRRKPFLSRAILWAIMGTTFIVLVWALLARIDEVVMVTGKLEPVGEVHVVQTAEPGVIRELLVRDGLQVSAGQPLLRLDSQAAAAEIHSLRERLASLRAESDFYRTVLGATGKENETERAAAREIAEKLPQDVRSLAKDRMEILRENRLLDAKIAGSVDGIELDPERLLLFHAAQLDRTEKIRSASLTAESAEKELQAIQSQAENTARLLKNTSDIVESYKKLIASGGVSKVDFLAREAEMIRIETQLQATRDRARRLEVEIAKAREEERNITTAYIKDAMSQKNLNMQRLAEIDARLGKLQLETTKEIADTESRLTAMEIRLSYHEITAPVDGIVFNIRGLKPGSAVPAFHELLDIVPSGQDLLAAVEIPNKDIGFVRTGLRCEVRIDSFPYREFGDIKGTVDLIGSDSIPPTAARPYAVFPAKVLLDSQTLNVRDQNIPLQSGMSVTVNILIRDRSVMGLFLDNLLGPVDRFRAVR